MNYDSQGNSFVSDAEWTRARTLMDLRKNLLAEAMTFMRKTLLTDPAMVVDPSGFDSAAAILVDEIRRPIPCPTCGNECK